MLLVQLLLRLLEELLEFQTQETQFTVRVCVIVYNKTVSRTPPLCMTDSIISATREMGLLFQDFDPVEWFTNEEAGFRSGFVHYNKRTNQHELL